MRKLAVFGAAAAVALGSIGAARADTATYNISGTFGEAINSCFNIAVLLTGEDCSYARTRSPALPIYSGPKFTGAFYARNSAGDSVAYSPVPGDTKLNIPVTGTIVIDDNGTPANGADDLISATWVLAAAAHNATTGSGDRAVERWDTFTHVMAATPVNSATANGAGFEYIIGERGRPTPVPLCAAGDPNDCFPSENAREANVKTPFWDTTYAAITPTSARVGISRTPTFGGNGPSSPLRPNVGGQTTGTFTGYQCLDNAGDNDCTTSEGMFGASQIIYRKEDGTTAIHPTLGDCADGINNDDSGPPQTSDSLIDAADPQCVPIAPSQPTGQTTVQVSPPGFENVVLVLTTDGLGAITEANAFWTREYVILSGPEGGNDPAGTYLNNNSWAGGRIAFSGQTSQEVPTAVDDAFVGANQVIENTPTNLAVLANDTRGGDPNVVTVEAGQDPANGTLVVNPDGESFTYTPDTNYSGADTFQYRVTDNDGDFSVATVNLTVSERVPVAGTFNTSSSGGNPTAAIPVLNSPTVLGTGTAGQHVVAVTGIATGGTCAVSGSAVSFTPAAGFNNAIGSCEYSVTDVDGDVDTGELRVSVSGNSGGGGGGGTSGPQLPSGGSSLDLLSLAALLAGAPLLARRRRTAR